MADRPNVVLVTTDQQRFDTIGALGYDYVDTPNLDRLFEEGVAFTDCHVTAPSCAPSRASLFTGLYPHSSGVYRNGDRWTETWVSDLADAGYQTVNVGKMHTQPYEADAGFDERYVVENKDRYLHDRWYFDEWDKALAARGLVKQQRDLYRLREDYEERLGAFEWELPPETQADNFVGGMAEWWIDHKPRTEPLFLQVGFPGPHPPYDPTPELAAEYLDREFPEPKGDADSIAAQPAAYRALRKHNRDVDHDSLVHQLDPDPAAVHRQRAYYMANVAMIDRQVGRLFDALERNGYLEDCVVVFCSDHGDALCDHGHAQKWTMYDEVTNVPVAVWSSNPDRIDCGRTVDGLCQLMDVGPTVLEYAGVDVPDWMQAESLAPACRGDDWEGRDYVFAEQARDAILQEATSVTMVRSDSWKLVHFLDDEDGQLFDLESDPEEVDDRWDDPAVAERRAELERALRDWRIRSDLEAAEWAADER